MDALSEKIEEFVRLWKRYSRASLDAENLLALARLRFPRRRILTRETDDGRLVDVVVGGPRTPSEKETELRLVEQREAANSEANVILLEELIPLGKQLAAQLAEAKAETRPLLKFLHLLNDERSRRKASDLWPKLHVDLESICLKAATDKTRDGKGKKRKLVKTTTTIARDLRWLAEFEQDFPDNLRGNVSAFAQRKNEERSTVSKALGRARTERERRNRAPRTKAPHKRA